jgi:transcriptional regulator with GAF, ATPase, and Fis domain
MDSSLWVHYCSRVDDAMRDAVEQSLANCDLRPQPLRAGAGAFGMVVCRGIDNEVLGVLHGTGSHAYALVVVVVQHGASARESWTAMSAGAADVLVWARVPHAAEQVRARLERWSNVQEIADSQRVAGSLIGSSRRWRALVRQVVEVAVYSQSAVLVVGETGTGKELIARLVHALDSRRARRELVVVDCSTVAPELSGSEFFGHERGAFTGAIAPREGAFTLANGGTLFLDEIGELPLALQGQLLRVIQEGKYKRIGANNWQHTEFRLVSATNRDLEAGIAGGTFRADLYHRIAGWVCRTPPLRDRVDDVLPLARHFQAEFCSAEGCEGFDEPVCQYLSSRAYPGNVRDLRRLVARLCHRHAGPGPITVGDVPLDERPLVPDAGDGWQTEEFIHAIARAVHRGVGLKEIGKAAENAAIRCAREEENQSVQRAAERLGVTPRTLQLRLSNREH